jgi:hypothetical protein
MMLFMSPAASSVLTSALACSKVLAGINLAFVKLGAAAVDSLVQVGAAGVLWLLVSSTAFMLPYAGCLFVGHPSQCALTQAALCHAIYYRHPVFRLCCCHLLLLPGDQLQQQPAFSHPQLT